MAKERHVAGDAQWIYCWEGFPDIFYFDSGVWEFVEAGWVEDLSDKIDWENVTKAGADAWNYPGPGGKIGKWGIPLEAYSDNIMYNVKLFEELGIRVPEDLQFTADEFYEVAKKCREGGYDPLANAAGDTALMGQEIFKVTLLPQLGAEEYLKLYNGETSWDRPEVREALEYVQKLIDVPITPASYTTMDLAESHRYFHTEQKACMFIVELGTLDAHSYQLNWEVNPMIFAWDSCVIQKC